MHYIIITLLSISIATFFIYLLANRLLSIHLKIKPLILCAFCALLINIVLPRIIINFVDVTKTLGVLAVFTIAFAYIIAYYNGNFSKQKEALDQIPLVVQVDTNLQDAIPIEKYDGNINNSLTEGETATRVIAQSKQSNSLPVGSICESLEIITMADVEVAAAATITEVDIAETIDDISGSVGNEKVSEVEENYDDKDNIEDVILSFETELSAVAEISTEVDSVETIDDIPEGDNEKISELVENNEILAHYDNQDHMEDAISSSLEMELSAVTVKAAEADTVEMTDDASEVVGYEKIFELEGNNEMVQTEQELQLPIDISYPASNDLDSLMDFAFMYKEQRKFTQALTIFRQALNLYPSSEAAPFLVMEIGTILKNNGQYDDAISVFCEARKLPGLQQNNMFEVEFVKTIAYLRIVKNMLLQHHLGFVSFNNIPDYVLKEIDAEFREWRDSV